MKEKVMSQNLLNQNWVRIPAEQDRQVLLEVSFDLVGRFARRQTPEQEFKSGPGQQVQLFLSLCQRHWLRQVGTGHQVQEEPAQGRAEFESVHEGFTSPE
jgi:hypothetical protein